MTTPTRSDNTHTLRTLTQRTLTQRTIVSLWLPIAVLILGLTFLVFVVIEYQRNTSLVEQNRALISGSAKAQLSNRISSLDAGDNWSKLEGDYEWIRYAPGTYWFNNGIQEFPWNRSVNSSANTTSEKWSDLWADMHSVMPTLMNAQRLTLLNNVKGALDSNDEVLITQSFNAYLEHKNAYYLSPQQEIVFSLSLVEIGAQEHWSPELVHAILVTGGRSDTPLFRPVVDLLFRHADLFSVDEFNSVIERLKQHLEAFNLSSYFLDNYLSHLDQPRLVLPSGLSDHDGVLNIIADKNWFIQRASKTLISAEPVLLDQELRLIESEFIEQGVLGNTDSLLLDDFLGDIAIANITLIVNKQQLEKDKRNQIAYLIIKSIMLIAFMALILLTLRLIDKNQQRRSEYLALREDFVKLVSHELKTPLAGIRAMAETLRKRVERNLSVQSYPERIVSEADKLWYMVDNILGFNRIQSTQVIIEKNLTKIKPLCDGIIDDIRSFSNKPYRVSNTIDDSIELAVDAELFSLVIKNIIVNAGLYNDHQTVELALSFDQASDSLLIEDNGVGISPADRDKVFKPFVRLTQSVRQSGTGLGLAICRRIMQLHNGELSLAQSSSDGSVWKISLVK